MKRNIKISNLNHSSHTKNEINKTLLSYTANTLVRFHF